MEKMIDNRNRLEKESETKLFDFFEKENEKNRQMFLQMANIFAGTAAVLGMGSGVPYHYPSGPPPLSLFGSTGQLNYRQNQTNTVKKPYLSSSPVSPYTSTENASQSDESEKSEEI